MKKLILLLACFFIVTFALGVTASDVKTFFWYDMMEMPYLKYRPAHGQLSYYVQPVEFVGVQPVADRYAQQLELTMGLSYSAEVTGYFFSSESANIWSSTLKSKIIDDTDFYLSVRGGVESYQYESALYGKNRFVTDAAVLSQLRLNRYLRLHNNAEIAYTLGDSIKYMLENGFVLNLNPYNTLQANFNSIFTSGTRIHSLEGAYKLIVNDDLNFVFYLTKRLDNPALHCENILEVHPSSTVTFKGNLIYNTGNANPENKYYTGSWIALKTEKAFTNFSLFADLIHQLDLNGEGALKLGMNVKL